MFIPAYLVADEATKGAVEEDREGKLLLFIDKFSSIICVERGSSSTVQAELNLWQAKWRRLKETQEDEDLPDTALNALDDCDGDIYPSIKGLLKILATLPVTVASAER